MDMTMTEKILARKAGRETVRPGDFLEIEPDLGLGNDITAPLAIEEFRKAGGRRAAFPERTWLVPDHFTPEQGHPLRRAGEGAARVRRRAAGGPLLRAGGGGRGARPAAGARRGAARAWP